MNGVQRTALCELDQHLEPPRRHIRTVGAAG